MNITIPYKTFDINKLPTIEKEPLKIVFPEKTKIIQPRIRFSLRNIKSNKTIILEGIIDSGADYCFFNHEIAEIIDIPIDKGKPLTVCGVGGKRQAYFHNVEFIFSLFGSKDKIIKYEVEAGFFPKEDNPYHEPSLLGQYGFFDHFNVTFNVAQSITIEPAFQ